MPADAVADRLPDSLRLFVDLLEHERLVTTLLRALVVPVDLADRWGLGVEEGRTGRRDRHHLPVLEVLDTACLAQERRDRRGEEHLTVPDAHHERRLAAHADELVRMVMVDCDE